MVNNAILYSFNYKFKSVCIFLTCLISLILKGNVMKYFKPGEQMRMMYYIISVMTQANS